MTDPESSLAKVTALAYAVDLHRDRDRTADTDRLNSEVLATAEAFEDYLTGQHEE